MVESMKSAMVDLGSTMAKVIRKQFSQTSELKARDELVEPSKKHALSPGSSREGRAMDRGGQAPREMSKSKQGVADDCVTVEEDECSSMKRLDPMKSKITCSRSGTTTHQPSQQMTTHAV